VSKKEKNECPRCGQINPPHARYCMYCGERLVEKKSGEKISPENKKELNVSVLYVLLAVLVVAGGAILYFAGVFDSPKVVIKQKEQPAQERIGNQSSVAFSQPQVIDLKTLQEMKKLEEKIASDPNNTGAMLTLGNKYFDFGHFEEAIKFYRMYLEKNPAAPDVLVDLGVCYYNLKDYDNAEKYMEKAVTINPRHQIALMNLGVVNEARGNIDKAKEYWRKAVNVNPNSTFGQRAQSFLNNY
jgi:tetratricopeptide (TPR) repeat protein